MPSTIQAKNATSPPTCLAKYIPEGHLLYTSQNQQSWFPCSILVVVINSSVIPFYHVNDVGVWLCGYYLKAVSDQQSTS